MSFWVNGNDVVRKITYSQGLSENTVNCIAQDSMGYIWVGTREGLNRYDGVSCKSYFASLNDINSLSSGYINKIFVDSGSIMWVQTDKGLDRYNPETDSFDKVRIKIGDYQIDHVEDMCEQSGIKWLATSMNGIVGVDVESSLVIWSGNKRSQIDTNIIKTNHVVFPNPFSICKKDDSHLWVVTRDSLGVFDSKSKVYNKTIALPLGLSVSKLCQYQDLLWLSTSKGLWIYDSEKSEFLGVTDFVKRHFPENIGDVAPFQDIRITSVVSHNDRLWASTDGKGVFIIDISKRFCVKFLKSNELRGGLSTNAIRCLYSDKDGNMWIGTVHNGLNFIANETKKFRCLEHTDDRLNFPSGNVSNFIQGKDGNLWAATYDGLCLIDERTMAVKNVVGKGAVINVLSQDDNGMIYLGTFNKGLQRYNPKDGRLVSVGGSSYNIDKSNIGALLSDHDGNLWVGTNGLYQFNKTGNTLSEIGGINSALITCLMEDRNGNIWVGSLGGLYTIIAESGRIIHYGSTLEDPFRISDDAINCLFQDRSGNIWVGTNGGGLNCIGEGKRNAVVYDKQNGLPSNVVHGIVEDLSGNLWLTTNGGLVRLSVDQEVVNVYDYTDGLVNNQFIEESIFLTESGKILCGGEKGMDYFYPDSIVNNMVRPRVVVQGYFVDNKPVVAGEDVGIYQRRIASDDTLILDYNKSYFSFHFTGIEFSNPVKVKYAYKLDGFENSWSYTKGERVVNYGNIPPGNYTFKVKAANSDGFWSKQPAMVKVIVEPPFSKTPFAYLIYLVCSGFILFLVHRYFLERKLLQSRLSYESGERKRIQELNQLKLRVFTHVSHEFRTPLSLIISPVQELLKRFTSKDENHKDLELIHNSAKKLQALVNQVLEIRKIESGAMVISPTDVDMHKFLNYCISSFQHWAHQKGLTLSIIHKDEKTVLSVDQNLIEKVVYNLLSNAIKYTLAGGSIIVETGLQSSYFAIKVIDTGVGISEYHQGKLFDLFYQVNENQESKDQGSGIGLALCKELVELHNGQITLSSIPGEGSCFTVLLPLTIVPTQVEPDSLSEQKILSQESSTQEYFPREVDEVESKLISVLLVEDNDDLRIFLKEKLLKYYNVVAAINGLEALDVAYDLQPDVVISDVMMPQMDGWELCAQIKSDIKISHIPVILLTALDDKENAIKGLELGADAYLSKPFNMDHVVCQINSMLENRKRLRDHYNRRPMEFIEQSGLTVLDQAFLEKIGQLVKDNISTSDFSVQVLSEMMGMSRTNLHMKIKALCELSPSEYIMKVRLNKAMDLLQKRQYRMGEIADMTGFSTASHFSRTFKKSYGCSPKDYLLHG